MTPRSAPPRTRIQKRNTQLILEAGLDVFSAEGFRGATLDRIADTAGLSKPNLLYYFPSKDAIHRAVLENLMETWLAPLRGIDPAGDPIEEILAYVAVKLDMARDFPRESRLFAQEIVQGAPHFLDQIEGPLKALVDEKAYVIGAWIAAERIAPLDPYHLIFSVWATTQHYADFDVQVRGILAQNEGGHFDSAHTFLADLYRRALTRD